MSVIRIGGNPTIEIEYQLLGAVRNVRRQPVDPQGSILDAAMRDRAVARRSRQPLQSIGEARVAVRQPCFRIERHGRFCISLCRNHRHQHLLQVSVAARVVEPDVAGAESIAQVEQNRHLPEAVVILALGLQMTVPLRS